MASSKKWNIVCQTDSHVTTISDTEPTECPNDAGHTIGDVTYKGVVDSIFACCPCDGTSKSGNQRLLVISASGDDSTGFVIPDDFGTLVSLNLVGMPLDGTAYGASKDIDFISEYAGDGEQCDGDGETDDSSTYTTGGALTEWFRLDITSLAPAIAPDDVFSLNIKHNAVGGNIGYKCFELEYYSL